MISAQVTAYGAEGCCKRTNTARALVVDVDVDTAGVRDRLRDRGIRE